MRRARETVGVGREFGILEARRIDTDDHQVADEAGEVAHDELEVLPGLDEAPDGIEDIGGATVCHDLRHVHQHVTADEAEHRRDVGGADALAGEGNHLVEGAQRVAHAALARSREQQQGVRVGLDLLGLGDACELVGDAAGPDRAQLELLRPRPDRLRDLVQLRRRHHEDDVRRRFLDRLEQCVERAVRQHVHFVDDEDLVAIAGRGDAEPLDDHFADVVDTGVRRGVELDHVDVAALGDLDAGIARAARVGGRPGLAVERAREDAGGGRLADAAGSREDERLGDAPALDGVAQRLRHAHLADDIVEALGTPLASEHLIRAGHWFGSRSGTSTVRSSVSGLRSRRPSRSTRCR